MVLGKMKGGGRGLVSEEVFQGGASAMDKHLPNPKAERPTQRIPTSLKKQCVTLKKNHTEITYKKERRENREKEKREKKRNISMQQCRISK